ncbi:MAG: PstS family phosphate ABC transporter substrate-binding protein [Fluviicola sp.]
MLKSMPYYVAVMLCALLFSCGKNNEIIEKSTTPNPIFKGSDTEFEMIKEINEQFSSTHSKAQKFEVQGGGSQTGIEALIKKDAIVANVSRKMTEDEQDRCRKNGIDPVEVIIAMDAIAIITNPKASIDSLSLLELRQIYQGEITNWKEVGGADSPIHLYGREATSGTHDYMHHKVFRDADETNITQLNTTAEVIEAVKNDPLGIGYVGIGSLTDLNGKPNADVWATYIYIEGNEAHSPYEREAIRDGEYPLSRPLFQYFDGIPQGTLKEFLDFTLSPKGQSIVKKHGYFPINDFHRQLNAYNGISTKD